MHKYSIAVFIIFLTVANGLFAQKKDFEKYIPTDNINRRKDDNKRRNAPKRKVYRQIIKNETKNTLYGNPCVLEATHKMGFEYVVQVQIGDQSVPEVKRIWNNFKVKTRLFFFKTPFWKLILKGKIKKCRIKSGDKVG